jgi:hypothetical protein
MRPINFVKNEGVRAFFEAIVPHYRLPSRATVKKYLAEMYKQGVLKIKMALAPLRAEPPPAARGLSVCLITDAWGARNGKSYNAVLATSLDDDFNHQLHCLNLSEFDKSHHTAEVLAGMLKDTLSYGNYNVPVTSIFRTVHDAGSNINKGLYLCARVWWWWCLPGSHPFLFAWISPLPLACHNTKPTAVPDAGLESSNCIAHALQRTILNSIKACPSVVAMLTKLKMAVKALNQSHVQRAYLREAQKALGVFEHKMVQANATR